MAPYINTAAMIIDAQVQLSNITNTGALLGNNTDHIATSNDTQPEIEPKPPYWDYPSRITLTVTLTFIMALAVVGNLMVVGVILQNKGMRTRTNMLLCNLAVADLLCALLDMPFSLVTVLNGNWILGPVVCQLSGFSTILFFVVTIHTLMYISVHKCVSIRHPYSQVRIFL